MKDTVIYHSADFDGLFSGEICKKFLENPEMIGWNFGDPKVPFPEEGKVYIVDLSPDCLDPESTWDLSRIVWVDHHKSSIEKWKETKIAGYRIDGVAACRLCWQWFNWDLEMDPLPDKEDYVYRLVDEPTAVRLAGEYDIWDKRDPAAEVFQFGLRCRDLTESDWGYLLSVYGPLTEYLDAGSAAMAYQRKMDKSVMRGAFFLEWEGQKFLAANLGRFNSLTFKSIDVPETGHTALMGFRLIGPNKWTVSMYHAQHNTEVDLSQIAVRHGGGGHRGACGFVQSTEFMEKNIFSQVKIMD